MTEAVCFLIRSAGEQVLCSFGFHRVTTRGPMSYCGRVNCGWEERR